MSAKNCPSAPKKQTRQKPATPPPPPVPVLANVPCQRDQQAYGLYLEQHSQRWIAARLKCAQPTVLRGIRRMEKWLATTLPEDRGEYTATEKLRLALAKHERRMERLLKMSLREFRRSRKTIPMKKTITTTETTNEKGEKVKIRVEEWGKPQIGRKGLLDSAAKASHEITVLAAGWLGPGNARVSDEGSLVNQPQSNAAPACISQSLMHPMPPREESARPPSPPVSKVAEKKPPVNQKTDHQSIVTSRRPTACATPSDPSPRNETTRKTCIRKQPRRAIGTVGSEEQALEPPVLAKPCEAEPRGRPFPG